MTLHEEPSEVGVRDLHDRLSEHLDRVAQGDEIVVTRRGRRIARLTPIDAGDRLEELVARGLVTPPTSSGRTLREPVKARGTVSDLVADQRR